MFFEERHEQIVQLLQGGKTMSVSELAKRLFVSEATVRRDLNVLEKEGIARRVHGGAVLIGHFRDVPLLVREREELEAKQKIGKTAASLVRENDVIIMDASSTVYSMVPYLKRFKNIVVVTSGVKTALALGENHTKTYLTGGLMIDNSYSLVGGHTVDFIASLSADIVFYSCRGITRDGCINDTSVEEAQLRQVMCRHAKRKVLLAAGSKIGRDYFYVHGHVSDMDDIICDQPVPEAWRTPNAEGKAPRIWLSEEM